MQRISHADLSKYRENTWKDMERIVRYDWQPATKETITELNKTDLKSIPTFRYADIGYRIAYKIANISCGIICVGMFCFLIYCLIVNPQYLLVLFPSYFMMGIIVLGCLNSRDVHGKELVEKAQTGDFKELDVNASVYYRGFGYPNIKGIFPHVWTLFSEKSVYTDEYGCWLLYVGDIFGKTKKALLFEYDSEGQKQYEVILLIY